MTITIPFWLIFILLLFFFPTFRAFIVFLFLFSVVEQTLPNTEPTTEPTVPDAQSAVENPAISEAPTTAKGDLVIEITKNSSWISVKDQNRKVLAQKEYKQGEVLTFNGNDYALIIGAPGNVRITYKGEAYPLTVDGRVAKFKLPKP